MKVLELSLIPVNTTFIQLEAAIVLAAGAGKYNAIFFNEADNSYRNFKTSTNIQTDGKSTNAPAQRFQSPTQGWMNIINGMASLRLNYIANK